MIIAAFVLGIVGIVFACGWGSITCFFALATSVTGLVLAILNRRNGATGKMVTAGLVLCIIATALAGISLVYWIRAVMMLNSLSRAFSGWL